MRIWPEASNGAGRSVTTSAGDATRTGGTGETAGAEGSAGGVRTGVRSGDGATVAVAIGVGAAVDIEGAGVSVRLAADGV